jgi:hypothetical protein
MKEVQENSKNMIINCKTTLANQTLNHEKEKECLKVQIEDQCLQTMNQINQSQFLSFQEKDNAKADMNLCLANQLDEVEKLKKSLSEKVQMEAQYLQTINQMKNSQYFTDSSAAEMNRQIAEQFNEIEILTESLAAEKRSNINLLNQVSSLELMMQNNFLEQEDPKPYIQNPPKNAGPDAGPFLDQMGDAECKKDKGKPLTLNKN